MPPQRAWTDTHEEDGSASLEFITAGMILLVPLVYLVLVMSALQGGALAVEGAARQAARVYVQADDEAGAREAADVAIRFALADYGFEDSRVATRVDCSPDPRDCLRRLGMVTVTVRVSVALPLVPQVLDLSVPLEVPLETAATQQVSRFRGAG